jgi:hypothetical protein
MKYFLLLFPLVIVHPIVGQCKLVIVKEGIKNTLINNGLVILDHDYKNTLIIEK